MSTFTSSLPDNLLAELREVAERLKVPKNSIIEKALSMYLEHVRRSEYIRSYKLASDDVDVLSMAEEGMADYLSSLEAIEK